MSNCTLFNNATYTSTHAPPSHGPNIKACAVGVYLDHIPALVSCAGNSTIAFFDEGCFAYVNLSKPSSRAN